MPKPVSRTVRALLGIGALGALSLLVATVVLAWRAKQRRDETRLELLALAEVVRAARPGSIAYFHSHSKDPTGQDTLGVATFR